MPQALRILVVDDSPPMRIVLRDYLEKAGHVVVAEVDNQEQALKEYAAHTPDLVTLDLALVVGNGLGVLNALREVDPKARVLVISGNSQQKLLDRVKASGAGAILHKPFEPGELAQALAQVMAA